MGSISTAMVSTAEAMRVIQRQVTVVQNNIVNASTPNYARLDQATLANRFNPDSESTSGGISAAPLISGRDRFLETAVWERQTAAGYSDQSLTSLRAIESAIPVTADSGIPAALDNFYSSAAQLALAPNSELARQGVLDRAQAAARAFNQAANEFGTLTARAGTELTNTVRQVNTVAAEIAAINAERKSNFRNVTDAGLDARLHTALEKLSGLVDHNSLTQEDGSVVVFVSGQAPLVVGEQAYPLTTAFDNVEYRLVDGRGEDVTRTVTTGKLGALLEVRNSTLPGYSAQLDTLARGFADQVNGILAGGLAQNGLPPTQNLFTYDATAGAAATLAVTGITGAELAAAGAGEPGGNANANALAQLSNRPAIGGLTLAQYYGAMASTLGTRLDSVRGRNSSDQQLLLQARTLRQEATGVSVDQEAAKLLEYQRGFQAVGQVMGVLNELSQTLLNMLQ
jgi:flagellar hook-associated protein 1 FlgK